MELGAVLVPVPALGLPFNAHLLNKISCKIALKAGSINAHELALAGALGHAATLLHLALLGDKMNLPWGVGKGNTSQLENDGIVTAEHIASVIRPVTGLPLSRNLGIIALQVL